MRLNNKSKRLHLSLLTFCLLFGSSFFTSCYKDLSKLGTDTIEPVKLDTAGISKVLYVEQQSDLVLEPKLENTEGLKFKWEISKYADEYKKDREVIGENLHLHYTVTKPLASKPYRLILTITDTNNGNLEYIYDWALNVRGAIISGLLIADSEDGIHTDFSYIKSPTLSVKYKGDQKILRQMLSKTKAGPIKGRVDDIFYSYFGNSYKYFRAGTVVWARTKDGQVLQFNSVDFELLSDLKGDKLVLYKTTPDLKAEQLFLSSGSIFMKTNGGFYAMSDIRQYSRPNMMPFFDVPIDHLNNVSISNGVIGRAYWQSNEAQAIWYNDKAGRIEALYSANIGSTPIIQLYDSCTAFNPSNLIGKKAITIANTRDLKGARILLKDVATGDFELYTVIHRVNEKKNRQGKIEQAASAAVGDKKFSVPANMATVLNQAKSVFFDNNQNLLFIVTEQHIYVATYGLGEEMTFYDTPRYTIPSGERIVLGKQFEQGEWQVNAGGLWPSITLAYNNNALIIASQKGDKEGIVRVLPIDGKNAAVGLLLPDKAETFTGFAEILDVTHIGE